jgi:protein-tyrosine sulfotransferase
VLSEATRRDIAKFLRYGLERRSFSPSSSTAQISRQAFDAARAIRGGDRRPAIVIHGLLPRCGTVYVGELLRLHPELHAYPNEIWEFPFLLHTPRVLRLEEEFLWTYEQNREKIGEQDFLPLFGSALIGYLYQGVPPGRRMLLKVPSVQHLDYFYQAFPHEQLLVLVRDGRDVVQSTLKTWPQLRFWMVCLRWRRAARMALACDERFRGREGYWLGRFEDAVQEPEAFVREVCQRFRLDETRFPYERIASIPVHGSSTTQVGGKVTWSPVARGGGFRPVGRWMTWSRYHKWLFKCIAGRELVQLGYCEDLSW